MPNILEKNRVNLWFVAGALTLCGCASNPEPTPEPTAIAAPPTAVPPQVRPTVVTPPFPDSATPIAPAIENSVADATSSQPSATDSEEKREKVRSLRSDISVMESQKRALNQRKESLIKDGHPDHPDAGGPNYEENIRQRDDTIARKQKEIDDIMLGS